MGIYIADYNIQGAAENWTFPSDTDSNYSHILAQVSLIAAIALPIIIFLLSERLRIEETKTGLNLDLVPRVGKPGNKKNGLPYSKSFIRRWASIPEGNEEDSESGDEMDEIELESKPKAREVLFVRITADLGREEGTLV